MLHLQWTESADLQAASASWREGPLTASLRIEPAFCLKGEPALRYTVALQTGDWLGPTVDCTIRTRPGGGHPLDRAQKAAATALRLLVANFDDLCPETGSASAGPRRASPAPPRSPSRASGWSLEACSTGAE